MFGQSGKNCIAVLTSVPNVRRRHGCLTVKAWGSNGLQTAVNFMPCLPCYILRVRKSFARGKHWRDTGIAAVKKLFPI